MTTQTIENSDLEAAASQPDDTLEVPGAPSDPSIRFRRFRGESDFPHMVRIINEANELDGNEEVSTVENMRSAYANLKNSDPYRDVLIVEVDGNPEGYSRVDWWAELEGNIIYSHFYHLTQVARGRGLEVPINRYNEALLRENAREAGHTGDRPQYFDTWTFDNNTVKLSALEGYEVARHSYVMVRPDLENIPDYPLPEGIEVRPVTPEQFHAIWEAEVEAFKDHWGMDETEESDFERWQHAWPLTFQPHLWQVAWDGDQVAGMVRNFIVEESNARFGRKRGYTENISVRRPWRRKGLARALIARSFRVLKEQGMEEAALGVDTENPNGALQLYESMGFKQHRHEVSLRKRW